MMRPRTAHLFFVVLGFLLILAGITITLHWQDYDPGLVTAFICVGIALMLLVGWLKYRTGLVRVRFNHDQLGPATSVIVIGFLFILGAITMHLMANDNERLMTLIVLIGLFLMIFGVLMARSDKVEIKLDEELLEQEAERY